MNRDKVRELMDEAKMAFDTIAKAHGLAAGEVRASFTDKNVKLSIEIAEVGVSGEVMDREAILLQRCALGFGLPENAYGMEFSEGRHTYKITGLSSRRAQYPLIAEREDGKKFKFSLEHVKALLGVKA